MNFFVKIKEKYLVLKKKAVYLPSDSGMNPTARAGSRLIHFLMIQFEIGKVYECRSICDYDCVWTYTVIARTNSTVTIKNDETGVVEKKRILGYSKAFGIENVHPLGNYSMCPVLSADRARF